VYNPGNKFISSPPGGVSRQGTAREEAPPAVSAAQKPPAECRPVRMSKKMCGEKAFAIE